ncbi:hypothetical protein UFOVP599_45 [uncultured Caudovirales phage]|uniref:Uncharacterized protein n=1 Tax=uncultured Caudovirales phage TaxID=2100421 RepID=A0A6J5N0Z7_9CAUD|nr:hypothetical protein UFOVP599_45 [uncultured Caudovirales phage]
MASFTPVAALAEVPSPNQGFNTLGSLMSLDQKQLALQKSKELLPYEIAAGKAQASSAETQAARAGVEYQQHNANVARSVFGGFLTDPDFISGNSEAMVKKLDAGSKYLKSIGVEPPDGGEAFRKMIEAAKKDPQAAYQEIKNGVQQAGGAQNQYASMQATQPTMVYGGGTAGTPSGAPSAPVQPGAQAPTGVTPQQMSQPAPSEFSKKSPLLYPTRQAGQPIVGALPSEEEDRKIGSMVRSNLISRQGEIPQSRRSIDEVIKKANELEKEATFATTGVFGSAERNLSTFLGTEQGIRYKELSKDLANAQIANIQASGGSLATDAGKQLARMANGDETYPPKVLVEIARRTQADMTGLDMKATAIQKFATKFGDNNIKAFEQDWSKNADPKIFQLKNIFDDPNLSPAEKAEARNKLIGKDEKQLKIFNEKWNNIKKLEQTGSL